MDAHEGVHIEVEKENSYVNSDLSGSVRAIGTNTVGNRSG
jgi:hypothetical protein